MKEIGKVISSDPNRAEILVMRESSCGGHCDKCASSCSKTVTIITNNNAEVSPGDIVEVEAGASAIVGLAALFYIVPLTFIVIGVLLSKWLFPTGLYGFTSDLAAVVMGAVFCCIALLGIRFTTKGHEIDYQVKRYNE